MLSKVRSFATKGIEGIPIEVEVDLCSKTPRFLIVGLPDTAIREAKDRVKTAMTHSGYLFPYKRILINLAPGDLKKQGPQYDLPIALGLMTASEQIPAEKLAQIAFVGELALDGTLRPVKGVIAMVEASYRCGIKKMAVPEENAKEAAMFELVDVYPIASLTDAVRLLTTDEIKPFHYSIPADTSEEKADYSEVVGQEYSKRAMLIAAAGGHNCLMIGPPGSGKTMLARRITTILPRLTKQEVIETTRIYSVAGMVSSRDSCQYSPPFRAPHHTISNAGMAGGGCNPRPGELSLAHNGVLFLDELAEFSRGTLEVLRQPLESGQVVISRARESVCYPASFFLVAAMNPCPCGYLGDTIKNCRCDSYSIERYRHRISGPLLDRFDLHVEVARIKYQDLVSDRKGMDSQTMRNAVLNVRNVQRKRLEKHGLSTNSQITPALIKEYCRVDENGSALLRQAINELGLSARAYHKILKVARTIADLERSEFLDACHVSEAIQYRSLDRVML